MPPGQAVALFRRRRTVGGQRNPYTDDLSSGCADRAGDGVSKRAKIDILGCAAGDVAAGSLGDGLPGHAVRTKGGTKS